MNFNPFIQKWLRDGRTSFTTGLPDKFTHRPNPYEIDPQPAIDEFSRRYPGERFIELHHQQDPESSHDRARMFRDWRELGLFEHKTKATPEEVAEALKDITDEAADTSAKLDKKDYDYKGQYQRMKEFAATLGLPPIEEEGEGAEMDDEGKAEGKGLPSAVMHYALGEDDIRKLCGPVPIYRYPELQKFASPEEMFKGADAVVLLFLTESKDIGHWLAVLNFPNHYEVFDSFGVSVSCALVISFCVSRFEVNLRFSPARLAVLLVHFETPLPVKKLTTHIPQIPQYPHKHTD